MTEGQNNASSSHSHTLNTDDATGTQGGEDERSVQDIIKDLSSDDLDALILSAAPDKFVSKDKVEDIVKERLNSEREQRKAEAERKALEEQNEFKALYEKEKSEREKLATQHQEEAQARRQDRIQFELKDALRDEGINPDYLPLALRVADTSTVEDKDGKLEGIPGVVKAVKDASPVWFGTPNSTHDIPGSEPAGNFDELTAEKRQEHAEIARRQLHQSF